MKYFPARIPLFKGIMAFLLLLVCAVVCSQNQAILNGVITNGTTGLPVIGAKITVNNQTTYSVSGGNYSLVIFPVGTYTVTCSKTGFDNYSSVPVTFQQGVTVTINVQMLDTPYPPESVAAVLDTISPPKVNISWQQPAGNYELIYDDGIQDDFTVWATQGNMNAVKFTPVSYPAKITGGSVNIGTLANYPPGSNPLVPFQVSIYNDAGPGGMPGTVIAGPVDVIPSGFGWIHFSVPVPPVINSGHFYIVMIQGGNAPNAAGIAVDQTNTALRSFQRFVTGNAPWLPADGNFMMRATVKGAGGPLDFIPESGSIVNYQVWRLRQGEEMNPYIWTLVGEQTGTAITDYSWPSLSCSPYRWAVKTQYSGNRWSSATFSNVIGKCWTVQVTIQTELTCSAATLSGTNVKLENLVYPDTLYTATLDTNGIILFPKVWKGTYELTVTRFNYLPYTLNTGVSTDTTLQVVLQQERPAPENLVVNNKSLKVTWHQPVAEKELFTEQWSSGNFSANGWTIEGGYNWYVSQTLGNPSPSAMFDWNPQVINYSQSLISKNITGNNSTILKLQYDVFLDNYENSTVNQLAVELWDGTIWHQLKNHDNTKGDIPWTTELVDISSYSNMTFRVRFRAYGGDSYDINGWHIDNIKIIEAESDSILSACILGYYISMNNAIIGFTTDTSWTIPGNLVQYGTSYNVCVEAVFGSGNSPRTCTDFTSHYLIPPANLTGIDVEDAAYLTWDQPIASKSNTDNWAPPPGLTGYYIYRDGILRDSVSSPDTLFYYDFSLDPGTYIYGVSAKYDLTPYGFPGQTDQSVQAGPVTVILDYGRLLPFTEPWNQGTFTYNDWTFLPAQGNWVINTSEGNPLPSAEYSWEPLQNDYKYFLQSPVLSANSVQCAKVWLDFDYFLDDLNFTGQEQLSAEIYYNSRWHVLETFANSGDIPWTNRHIDISIVRGKSFKIRFAAKGINSADIFAWRIDNINIYSVCNPARYLSGDASGYDINLTWSPPDCSGNGLLLDEGFEGELFPPENWTQIITNTSATWIHSGMASFWGVHSGDYSTGVLWDYFHQDEWLIAQDIEVTGNLQFWSFAFQGSVHLDHYYVKVSADNGASWDILLDMSALPPYSSSSGYNAWNTPYNIDMSGYTGEVVDIAWQAVDGDNLGLWYAWAIDDCMIGTKNIYPVKQARSILGYDIYRQDFGYGDYNKINTELVQDTSYTDTDLTAGDYRYFVIAMLDECNLVTPSDTVTVDVITDISNQKTEKTNIYPNPAWDILNVVSHDPVEKIEFLNLLGKIVVREDIGYKRKFQSNVSSLSPGIYFIKVKTEGGTKTIKVMVTK